MYRLSYTQVFSSGIENLADRPEVSRACVSMLPSIVGVSL
jgi:hypothetical protein